MSYLKNVRMWIRGLIAALITSSATAVLSVLGVNVAEAAGATVSKLNLDQLLIVTISGGIVGVAAYLQRSPLPPLDEEQPKPKSKSFRRP